MMALVTVQDFVKQQADHMPKVGEVALGHLNNVSMVVLEVQEEEVEVAIPIVQVAKIKWEVV